MTFATKNNKCYELDSFDFGRMSRTGIYLLSGKINRVIGVEKYLWSFLVWKTGLLLETGCRIFYIHRCSKNWRIPGSVHNPLLQYPEFHPVLVQRKIHRLLCLATAYLLSKRPIPM